MSEYRENRDEVMRTISGGGGWTEEAEEAAKKTFAYHKAEVLDRFHALTESLRAYRKKSQD